MIERNKFSRTISFWAAIWLICAAMLGGGCPKSDQGSSTVQRRTEATNSSTALVDSSPGTVEQVQPLESAGPVEVDTPGRQESMEELVVGGIEEYFLFYPARYPAGNWRPSGLKFQDVWFKSVDGTELHGWYCPAKEPQAVVLFFHGNAGNLAHRGDRLELMQRDFRTSVFIFDYRGYGRSDGTPSVRGCLADCRAAVKQLEQLAAVPSNEMIFLGRSLGGAFAVETARLLGDKAPRGLVLERTFSSLQDVGAHHFPCLGWVLIDPHKLNSEASMANYRGSLLVSHGDSDSTIPIRLGRKVFDAANEPKTFLAIPGVGHNSPDTAEYLAVLEAFLQSGESEQY